MGTKKNDKASTKGKLIGDPPVAQHKRAAAALQYLEPKLAALKPDELMHITVDVTRAMQIAMGAVPKIALLRSEIAKQVPAHDLEAVDHLADYALGAWYAHILAMPPSDVESPVQPLLAEALPLREDLLTTAELVVRFGFFTEETVASIRAGTGYSDAANDLGRLAELYKSKWSDIATRVPVTRAQVDRAEDLADSPDFVAKSGR